MEDTNSNSITTGHTSVTTDTAIPPRVGTGSARPIPLVRSYEFTQMEELKNLARSLEQKALNVQEELTQKRIELERQEAQWAAEKAMLADRYKIDATIIDLNVGGKYFTTFKDTLCTVPGSMLAAMFSGRHPVARDSKGRYFIDRDGRVFDYILNFLRTGNILMPKQENMRKRVLQEVEYYGLTEAVFSTFCLFEGSTLLGLKQQRQLVEWHQGRVDFDGQPIWQLVYKATRDGFGAANFHSMCDYKGETITVIQSDNGYLFGGHSPISWKSRNDYAWNPKTWIFSLTNPSGHPPIRMPCTGPYHGNKKSIMDKPTYGPTFGGGHDIYICNNSNETPGSYTNLLHSFSLEGYEHGTDAATNFLTGSYTGWTVAEIEVFKLKK